MFLTSVAEGARNLVIRIEIAVNRALGRQFIPRERSLFHIETSSACNLKCRFCAYTKKSTPTVGMSYDKFVDTVHQALDLGYSRFELTPCTGDVFMDRSLMRKLEHLERNRRVAGYEFFTNLTIPKPDTVEQLADLRKLDHLTVSVYGHDADSFIAITLGTEKLYSRLIANLEALLRVNHRASYGLSIGLRTSRRRTGASDSALLALIERLRKTGAEVRSSRSYNNWGGFISQRDVEGLDMQIKSTAGEYKRGACEKLLTSVQVTATGIVNACACRDADATLRIGNVNSTPLAEILSPENADYMAIIEEQQRGEFRPICRSCDFYKSIYHHRTHYRREGISVMSLAEFREQLALRRGKALSTTNK